MLFALVLGPIALGAGVVAALGGFAALTGRGPATLNTGTLLDLLYSGARKDGDVVQYVTLAGCTLLFCAGAYAIYWAWKRKPEASSSCR